MKEIIRRIALDLGADVCGFADAGDFATEPTGFRPRDIWPECGGVIALGIALPMGAMAANSRLVYTSINGGMSGRIDELEFRLAKELEKRFNMPAMPLPCDGPYDDWDAGTLTGRGMLDMKRAAYLAGLGVPGKSTLLLNTQFGNRLTLGAILTAQAFDTDPPAPDICIKGCRRCADACPVGAISENGVSQTLCRPNTYITNSRGFDIVNCHACRDACPMKNGAVKR